MTFPSPEALTEWTGQTALAVRVRAHLDPQSGPIEEAPVWHLSPTDSPRPPMFQMYVGQAQEAPLLEDRAVFEQDGKYYLHLVRLSFGDADRQLAVELMPDAIRKALQLEVWVEAPDAPDQWDHHTMWDVAPALVRWQPDSAGTNYWEFVGKVRRPARAFNDLMTRAEQQYGEVPLFGSLRGEGAIPEQTLRQPPWPSFKVWPGPSTPIQREHLDLPE